MAVKVTLFCWEEMDAVSRFNKRRWLTMKTTKQKRLFMLMPVWLLLFGLLLWAGTASAGWNDFVYRRKEKE